MIKNDEEKAMKARSIMVTNMLNKERLKWWLFGMLCFPIIFTIILFLAQNNL